MCAAQVCRPQRELDIDDSCGKRPIIAMHVISLEENGALTLVKKAFISRYRQLIGVIA
jgi:hypothetical protein